MNIQSIGYKSTAFIYDSIDNYLTHVFVIEKASKIFIIDTFCGSESMFALLDSIKDISKDKEIIIINTHFHWDHVWGNCSFKDNTIISHEMCRDMLNNTWEAQINENKKYTMGLCEKHLPNLTFKEKLFFQDDGIEIFHSPGHTSDSISIFDHDQKILYVGDNLEKPIIYVESKDIDAYIHTLENYLTYQPQKIVSGHTLDITENDISDTIQYLKNLLAGQSIHFPSEYMNKIHQQNLKIIRKA